ncbi:MAG: hypothetical protein MN733_39255 [Nitrososphaera sp.]|nr:hypothetical protein [Nitrososphaera sp.]
MNNLTHSHPHSEFSICWHRDGHAVKLIACNLSATEAQHYMEQLSEDCGQPIITYYDGLIVNESAEENCGYYFTDEDLPDEMYSREFAEEKAAE